MHIRNAPCISAFITTYFSTFLRNIAMLFYSFSHCFYFSLLRRESCACRHIRWSIVSSFLTFASSALHVYHTNHINNVCYMRPYLRNLWNCLKDVKLFSTCVFLLDLLKAIFLSYLLIVLGYIKIDIYFGVFINIDINIYIYIDINREIVNNVGGISLMPYTSTWNNRGAEKLTPAAPVVDPTSASKGIPKLPSFGVTVVDAFEVKVMTCCDAELWLLWCVV